MSLFLALFALLPSIWAEPKGQAKVQEHQNRAAAEVLEKYSREYPLDNTTKARVREQLLRMRNLPGSTDHEARDRRADMGAAERSVAGALKAIRATSPPGPGKTRADAARVLAERAALARELVRSFSSATRLRTILEEIGAGESKELDHEELRSYLKNVLNVPDYAQVADSFHPRLNSRLHIFEEDTKLLRIYGMESKPIGRYFFCCLFSTDTAAGAIVWTDASGLATPPQNLRDHLAVVTIPAGTRVVIGPVADNFADQFGRLQPGGNTQFFIPEVRGFPFEEYRLRGGGGAISDIMLLSDDRRFWFRRVALGARQN